MNTDRKDNNSRGGRGGKGGKGNKKNPLAKDPAQKELDRVRNQLQEVHDRFNAKLDELKKVQDTPHLAKIKECREHLNKNVFPFINEFNAEEKKIHEILGKRKAEKMKHAEEMKEVMNKHRKKDESFTDYIQRNVKDVDNTLNELNAELREIKSLSDEKRLVKQIEKTKNRKLKILSYEDSQSQGPNYDQKLTEIKAKKQKYYDDLHATKKIIAENQAVFDKNSGKVDNLRKQLNKISKEREVLNKEMDEKKKALNKRWEEYKKEEDILRKQRAAEHKERKAKEEAQRIEEEKQRKKEEALRPPREAELNQTVELLKYLKSLKFNKKKPNSKIVHSLDSFSLFAPFKMTPPQKGAQIAVAIKAIQEKKAEIDAEREAFIIKREAELKKEEEEAAKKAAEAPVPVEAIAEETAPAPVEAVVEETTTEAAEAPAEVTEEVVASEE